MKFIDVVQPGGPEVLVLRETETPVPAAGQVLIKVFAAGINRPEILQRQGKYPPPPGASPILGLEVAGEVVGVGEGVMTPSVGDRVCALLTGGGYAEYAVAEASLCLPVPKGLSAIEAAAIPETFFTVWSNVFDRAHLQSGETLLVHGGASGIGTAAIQLGKAFGATVLVTAGSREKCDACTALGADLAINYRETDFVAACEKMTDGKGVDVILDMVAGDYVQKNIDIAAQDGRIVFIAGLKGMTTEVNFAKVMLNRLTITGSTLRPRDKAFKAVIAENLQEKVWPLIEAGKIKPKIHQVFPLSEAAKAHGALELGEHVGKIVLKVDEG